MILTGLLLGLAFLHVPLPADSAGRAVPLWQDTIAAGGAIACHGVLFSMPLRMLPWPASVEMRAHALESGELTSLISGGSAGPLIAPVVGLILTPVPHLWHRLPYSL